MKIESRHVNMQAIVWCTYSWDGSTPAKERWESENSLGFPLRIAGAEHDGKVPVKIRDRVVLLERPYVRVIER